jgi:hypothetical protein
LGYIAGRTGSRPNKVDYRTRRREYRADIGMPLSGRAGLPITQCGRY